MYSVRKSQKKSLIYGQKLTQYFFFSLVLVGWKWGHDDDCMIEGIIACVIAHYFYLGKRMLIWV